MGATTPGDHEQQRRGPRGPLVSSGHAAAVWDIRMCVCEGGVEAGDRGGGDCACDDGGVGESRGE